MAAHGSTDGVRILAVDDEMLNLELLERSLRRQYTVLTASSPARALEVLAQEPDVAVILSDYRMPGMTGTELLGETMVSHPDTKRIIITGYADNDAVVRAADAGEVDYVIKKPWRHKQLHQLLQEFVRGYHLARENRSLSQDLREVNQELEVRDELFAATIDSDKQELVHTTHELRLANRALEERAYRDSVTGLYGRQAFLDRMREEVARAHRYGHAVSLLYGDIDQFAALNDAIGREASDQALREVALLMTDDESSRVRESDIVGRLSGEEFGILLIETDRSGAAIKASRLREAVARTPLTSSGEHHMTISFGIACAPDNAIDADKLLMYAEHALTTAKRAGRNRQALYAPSNESDGSLYGNVAVAGGMGTAPSIPAIGTGAFRMADGCVPEVSKFLERTRALSAIYVDLSPLGRLQPLLGQAWHTSMHERIAEALEGMIGEVLDVRDVLCRTESQDFACLLAPGTGAQKQYRAATEIVDAMTERLDGLIDTVVPRHLRAHGRVIVASGGVLARTIGTARPHPGQVLEELLASTRSRARNRAFASAQGHRDALTTILAEDALTPVYQPIVELTSAEVVGYQALVHGPRNSPLESWDALALVTEASSLERSDEETWRHTRALRRELDRTRLRRALEGAQELLPAQRLFVQMGPRMFYDTTLMQTRVDEFLLRGVVQSTSLVFCVSETDAIEHFTELRRALAVYASQGFGVAILEVGKYSDQEALLQLEPHFIELSGELVRGLTQARGKREVVRSIVRLAQTNDTTVMARDVETADDLSALLQLGITFGRGKFLGRAGPPFPRIRTSVKRTIDRMNNAPVTPTPAPPADESDSN